MTPVKIERTDAELESDLHRLLHRYPPLAHDRHRVSVAVHDGVVTLKGFVKSIPTYAYVKEHVEAIPGIREIDATEFYNDEDIRLHAGHVIPYGVMVAVEYGAVILSGRMPESMTAEDLVKKVALVPGVHRVITSFV